MNIQLTAGNFFGTTVKRFQVAGISFSETHYAPHSTLPYHFHESHYFGFVLDGTYREKYGRRFRSCSPSMILFHPAGESHAQYFSNFPVHLFRIEITQAALEGLNLRDIDFSVPGGRNSLAFGCAHRLYREFCEPDEVSHLAIHALALEFIVQIKRHGSRLKNGPRRPQRWLIRAHEIVRERFLERLTLAEIAGFVGVHPVTLASEFRSHFDCTIGEMVRRERISYACNELAKCHGSIADIAASAGFYDQSHFARTFKKVTGLTPAQYRGGCGLH